MCDRYDGPMTIRAIRGATTLTVDQRDHLHDRTQELMTALIEANGLDTEDLISVFFTCTPDVVSDFPAAAARALNLGAVPFMCAQEMAVPGALPLVVRVMIHTNLDTPRDQIQHIYLHDAVSLRRDLAQ